MEKTISLPSIMLAPMEGVVDALMRDLLTRVGGIDLCVTEFIRVTQLVLPKKMFLRYCPELERECRTPSGTRVMVQLLGSDPELLAQNAAKAVSFGAPGIDLNFGCPAKTVNRHRGGSVLLEEPETLFKIIQAVRRAVPEKIPVTAKIRLGYLTKDRAIENAQAVEAAGADWITVHARTKAEGYLPPAHWDWLSKIKKHIQIPLIANGDIWTLEDYKRCVEVTGCDSVMLGRGLISRPDLARQISAFKKGDDVKPLGWSEIAGIFEEFSLRSFVLVPGSVVSRMKQWSKFLSRTYPEAGMFFEKIKRETKPGPVMSLFPLKKPEILAGI